MKRIVTFGCSYTFGDYLPDIGRVKTKPSKFAWPNILSKKLKRKCVNNGDSGASNKKIWYNVMNFDFEKNDLVICCWTHENRFTFFEDENKENKMNHILINRDKKSHIYFKSIYNEHDSFIDMYNRINHTKMYLDSLNIENHHILAKKSLHKDFAWNNVSFLNVFAKEDPLRDYALDRRHPGKEHHKFIANKLLKLIDDKEYYNK